MTDERSKALGDMWPSLAMTSLAVLEAHAVISEVSHCFCPVGVVFLPDPVDLQMQKKMRHHGVVPAVALRLLLSTKPCFFNIAQCSVLAYCVPLPTQQFGGVRGALPGTKKIRAADHDAVLHWAISRVA